MLILRSKKENLLDDVGVLDREFEKRLDFINMLDKLKALLYKLLSMIPLVREFTKLVEEKRDIRAATPYGYTPLGRLLKEYRTPLPRYERFVIFSGVASWQTSKGEVVPVYEDFNRRGTDYRLVGFRNRQRCMLRRWRTLWRRWQIRKNILCRITFEKAKRDKA